MDPSAVRNLLLNLKLQLLALPNLAKWGVLAFAGIIILREAITLGWNISRRRRALAPVSVQPDAGPLSAGTTADPMGALPAPDPLAGPVPPMPAVAPREQKMRSG